MAAVVRLVRASVGSTVKSAVERVGLHSRVAFRPSSVRALAFVEKRVGAKGYYGAANGLVMLAWLTIFGSAPPSVTTHIAAPSLIEKALEWFLSPGMPLQVVVITLVYVGLVYGGFRLLRIPGSAKTLWHLALLDAGTTAYVFVAAGVGAAALAYAERPTLGLLALAAAIAYVFYWRYRQYLWVTGGKARTAWMALVVSGAASFAVYQPLDARIEPVRVDSFEMVPTLDRGDVVLIDRWDKYISGPGLGGIYWVCHASEDCSPSRLIAGPGDSVKFRKGIYSRNGNEVVQRPGGTTNFCLGGRPRLKEITIEAMPDEKVEHFIVFARTVENLPNMAQVADASENHWSATEAPQKPILDTGTILVPPGRYLFANDMRSTGMTDRPPLFLADWPDVRGRVTTRLVPRGSAIDDVSLKSSVHTRVFRWLCQ